MKRNGMERHGMELHGIACFFEPIDNGQDRISYRRRNVKERIRDIHTIMMALVDGPHSYIPCIYGEKACASVEGLGYTWCPQRTDRSIKGVRMRK